MTRRRNKTEPNGHTAITRFAGTAGFRSMTPLFLYMAKRERTGAKQSLLALLSEESGGHEFRAFRRSLSDADRFFEKLSSDTHELQYSIRQLSLCPYLLRDMCEHVGTIPVTDPYTHYVRFVVDHWLQEAYICRNRGQRLLKNVARWLQRSRPRRSVTVRNLEASFVKWFKSQDFAAVRNSLVHEVGYYGEAIHMVSLYEHVAETNPTDSRRLQTIAATAEHHARLMERKNQAIVTKTVDLLDALYAIVFTTRVLGDGIRARERARNILRHKPRRDKRKFRRLTRHPLIRSISVGR